MSLGGDIIAHTNRERERVRKRLRVVPAIMHIKAAQLPSSVTSTSCEGMVVEVNMRTGHPFGH